MIHEEGCDCNIIHADVVEKVRGKMLPKEVYLKMADLFKLFGDSTRMQILHALEHNEMCVCDLAALLGMTKSAVSHQLKALRVADLVRFRKEGQVSFYALADDHIKEIMQIGFAHLWE